jgi:hypothetical protein
MIVAIIVAASAVGNAHPVAAQLPAAAPETSQIVTAATGEARIVPDRAAVYIGVQTRAATALAAGQENARKQRVIIDTIAALGIPKEQISTQSYNVSPETRYDREGQRPTVTGYVVSNIVRVEVRRLDQAGPVIDGALSKGANQINSLDFFSSNSDAARRDALAQAITKARGDAEAMARAAGGSIGRVIELVTGDAGPRPMFRQDVVRAGMAAAAAPTPVEPGEEVIRVTVTVRWQFVAPK